MEDIIIAINKDLEDGNYYSALFLTIIMPSICGALESDDGKDTKNRYIKWYDRFVRELHLSGEECYYLRCSLLHQGVTSHPSSSFARVIFTFPNKQRNVFHNNWIDGALNLDIPLFCQTLLNGVNLWLAIMKDDANYKRNVEKIMRTYSNGFGPFVGVPFIT